MSLCSSCSSREFHELPVFSTHSFTVGGQNGGWCNQGCQGIVDTGTSLLTVPNQVFSKLMQYIGAQADSNGQVGRVGWENEGEEAGDASIVGEQLLSSTWVGGALEIQFQRMTEVGKILQDDPVQLPAYHHCPTKPHP